MAKKRYYQDMKDRMDESKGMKKAMAKKKSDAGIKYVANDESMFGFPADSKVIPYPQNRTLSEAGPQNYDDLAGIDYQIDGDVAKMNKNKSKYRW